MVHYFIAAGIIVSPALLVTAWTGVTGSKMHLGFGLFASITTVGLHTLLIAFMIITGRILREAVRARELDQQFLDELNVFFSEKKVYPAAILAAFSIVAAAVLGYGNRAFQFHPAVHMLAGLSAMLFTLWAIPIEIKTLRNNQDLLDRAASELDRLDREVGPAQSEDEIAAEEEYDPNRLGKWSINLALGAWLPYLYWGLIEWRGAFGQVPLWMPIATALFSGYAFLCAWLARREIGDSPSGDEDAPAAS